MDQTSLSAPAASPVKPQAAVSPLQVRPDFVDIDLNSPQPPSKVVDLEQVPPTMVGHHVLPPQNLYPPGSHSGATATEKPCVPSRRTHKLQSSMSAVPPSALPVSTSTSAAPSQPRVDPSRGEGRDQINAQASNPAVAPSALSTSKCAASSWPTVNATSQPGVDPSRVQRPDSINVSSSNPVVAPSHLLLSTSISAASSRPTASRGQRQDQISADGVALPSDTDMANANESCPADPNIRFANITEAAAKQAFLDFSKRKWCYSTAPAKEMTIQDLRHFKTYRYCLETFTEHRFCEWVTEPCVGQTSDTPVSRSAPRAWDVPVTVPKLFQDGVQRMVMPQTSSVQACSKCNGLGRNMCLKCHGTGRAQCMWCNGRGQRMQMEMCQHCYGNGTESCRMCQNTNQQCVGCAGKGRVLTYMRLTVTWKNNVFEFITDHNSEFSSDLFKNVKGEKLYTDEQSKVPGITDFPDPAIIRASQNALEQHRTQFTASCRVLRQRQSIEWLPLSKVQYRWKENQLSYFVYGKENKVFVQNYPKTCCCVLL